MAVSTTLYRFQIELSDIGRGIYETLDMRVAQHPSETLHYLLTRVLAFALNTTPGLEFSSGGLSDPDDPSLSTPSSQGGKDLWIEIGNPSARKLHKAAKSANIVRVYTYKDPTLLIREMEAERVHRKDEIEVFAFGQEFLDRLAKILEKSNRWSLIVNDGVVTVGTGEKSEEGEIMRYSAQSETR